MAEHYILEPNMDVENILFFDSRLSIHSTFKACNIEFN